MARNQFAACSDRAERSPKKIISQPVQFFFDKSKVEANVMRYKNSPFGNFEYIGCYLSKGRGILHHLVRNTRQVANKWWNGTTRIQQCVKRVNNLTSIMTKDGNFSKASRPFYMAGCFNINDTIHN